MENNQLAQTEEIKTPNISESVTEVTVDPIYRHKDGRIFTKAQLISKMGLTEDRIKDGLAKGMITQIGDTDDPDQKFKHKDGRVFSVKEFASMGVDKNRLANGIELGMITPIEKKNQNITPAPLPEQKDVTTPSSVPSDGASVSTTPTTTPETTSIPTVPLTADGKPKTPPDETAATPPVVQAEPPKVDFNIAPTKKAVAPVSVNTEAKQSNQVVKNGITGVDQFAIITNPDAPIPTKEEEDAFVEQKNQKPTINIFDNASEYKKLKNAKRKDYLPNLDGGYDEIDVPDEVSVKKSEEIKAAGLENKIDYDRIAEVGDLIDQYYKNPEQNKEKKEELSGYIQNGDLYNFNKEVDEFSFIGKLLNGLESHFSKEEAKRIAGNTFFPLNELNSSVGEKIIDPATGQEAYKYTPAFKGNKAPEFQKIYTDLKNNLDFNNIENKDEILDNFRKVAAYYLGRQAISHPEFVESDPLNKVLNENELIGYRYIEAVAPEEIGKYRAALINPEDLKQSGKSNDEMIQAGLAKSQALKALANIGLSLVAPAAKDFLSHSIESYNNIAELFNKNMLYNSSIEDIQSSLRDLDSFKQDIDKYSALANKLNVSYSDLQNDSRYGMATYMEAQDLAQELVGQKHGGLMQPLIKLGIASKNFYNFLGDMIKTPFLSDKENEIRMANIMGENALLESEAYVRKRNLLGGGKEMVSMSPEFEADYDLIMNDKSLSDDEKRSSVADLIIQQPDGVKIDPSKAHTNLTLNSLWYGMTNLAADLAPYLAAEYLSGGMATDGVAPSALKKFSSSFIAAFTTGFHQSYLDAISRGSKNPFADAMRATTISSLAMAGAGVPSTMRNIIGTKSVVGRMINKMTDKEMLDMLRREPEAIGAFRKLYDKGVKVAESTVEGFKGGAKMVALTTAAQAINDQMYGDVKPISQYINGAKLELLKFTLFGGITGGIARGFKEKYGDLTKSALFEAGANPKKFLDELKSKLDNNEISQKEADQIKSNIELASKVFKTTKFINSQGKALSDADSRQLLFLKMQEADINKIIESDVPKPFLEKLSNRLLNIQERIGDIYSKIESPDLEKTDRVGVLQKGVFEPGKIIKDKFGNIGKIVQLNENNTVVVEDLKNKLRYLWKPEDIATERITPTVEKTTKPIPVFGPPSPRPAAAPVAKTEIKEKAPDVDSDIMVGDLIDKAGSYNGKKGIFYLDGQTVVFKEEGTSKEYDLGYINDIKDTPINQFGIQHEESVVKVNDDGTFNVRGNILRNGYSDPMQAINRDADGNVLSVTLDMPNGTKRTFRGGVAEDLAYQIHLQEITKDNATTKEFEDFVNEPETKQQIDNATISTTAEETPVATNEPVQRETLVPAVAEPAGQPIKTIEEAEIVRQIKPITDRMVEIEREFENRGYTIDTDYENEITVTDKDGELLGPEDLPKDLLELSGEYEKATSDLGDISDTAREKALAESRQVTEVEAEVVEPETKQIATIAEVPEVNETRNIIYPKGFREGTLLAQVKGERIQEKDLTAEYPELKKYNDTNLHTASAIDLWHLMQMGHPKDYGFSVSRNALIREFESMPLSKFRDLGFPTDASALYKNNYTGDVETLSKILDGDSFYEQAPFIAEHWSPLNDYGKEIISKEAKIKQKQEESSKLSKTKDKEKIRSLGYDITRLKDEIAILKEAEAKRTEVSNLKPITEKYKNRAEVPVGTRVYYPDYGYGTVEQMSDFVKGGTKNDVLNIKLDKPSISGDTSLLLSMDEMLLLPKKEAKAPIEIKAGEEIEFKSSEQKDMKGMKVEVPGLEKLDTILVQDGMSYKLYELSTGKIVGETEMAASPAEAVKEIANSIPANIQDRLLNKIYEGEKASRYRIAGEQGGISIINESPAYKAFKEQKIAEAENRPFVHDEETRKVFLDLARQAKEEGIESAVNTLTTWANNKVGKVYTIEEAKNILSNYRKQKDLAYRRSQNIPYPEADKVKREDTEESLIETIQRGYTRDRWAKIPEDIKKAALEAWRKEVAIYNKYGYYSKEYKTNKNFYGTLLSIEKYIIALASRNAAKKEAKIAAALKEMKDNFKRIDELYKEEGFDVLKAPEGETPKPLTTQETQLPSGAKAAFDRIKNRQKQAVAEQEIESTTEALSQFDAIIKKGSSETKGTELYHKAIELIGNTVNFNFRGWEAVAEAYHVALKLPEQERTQQQKELISLVSKAIGETEISEKETMPQETKVSNAVFDFPTNEIKTNIEEYQGRKTLFSERSARNVAENFDRNKFDPIVIYKHPDGNTYVLSGHSRLEGMKRRGEPTVPARIFEGTPEEAKDFALKSNKLGTLQTDIENAAYYRDQLKKGKSYNALLSEAKENEQPGSAKKIISYAHLNPNGKMMNALSQLEGTEGDSSSNLQSIAVKIGDIRAKNEHLTDAHENELYDFMVSDKDNIPTDKELQDVNSSINRSIAAVRFDNSEPLNLKKTVIKSAERIAWEKEKEDLENQVREYKKEVNPSKTTGWTGLKEKAIASLAKNKTKEAIDKALEDFNNDVNGIKTQYEKVLAQKKAELKAFEDKLAKHLLREKGLIEGEKNQQTLFSYRETKPEDFEDYVEGVTDMINEAPEKTLQQVQVEVANEFNDHTPAFKKLIEQAYNEAKNNLTGDIVKKEVLRGINRGFLKIGSTIFDNEQQLLAKAKQLSGSRFNALDKTAGFETRDGKPLGFNYDTDQVARERFDFSKLKKIGEGSDRIVFDLGNGKVLKVAKTARGLEQNIYEGDGYLDIIPEVYERGLNYVVTENINRIKGADLVPIYDVETQEQIGTTTAGKMFADLKKFHQGDWERYNPELQTTLEKYGFGDVRGYDILYGDFSAARNWGYKDGKPYLIDAGTLGGVEMIQKYKGVQNLSDPDFRKIYNESRNLKRQYADTDRYTKFHYDENGEILGFTHGGHIYLNGQKITAKTTMEEAGHIWVNHAKETNTSLYNAGLKKVLNSQYLKDVMSSEFYKKEALKQGKEGSKAYNDYMQEEALAKAIADEGAKFVTDAQRISFKEWVDKMWDNIMKAFGIRDLTPEEVSKLSLQEFAKMAAADVFAEKKAEEPVEQKAEPKKEKEQKVTTTQTVTNTQGEDVVEVVTIKTQNPYLYEGTEERQRGLYKHLMEADNVSQETKDFIKKNGITYEVSNSAQAEVMAEDILKTYGVRDALQIARGSDVHASVRSAIYAKAIDGAYIKEMKAKTPQEKINAAREWRDLVTEYANQLTAGGQFTAYANHFYRTSPMGFVMKENADRQDRFNEWAKGKEKTLQELWEEINATAEGRSIVNLEFEKARKAEKEAERKARDKKIDDFFDKLKINPKNTYSMVIPLGVLNPAIDTMKLAVKAGDRVVDAVQKAIDQISEKIGDGWNKEAFRKDYEEMLTKAFGAEGKKSKEATELETRIKGLEKQIEKLKEKIAKGGEFEEKKEKKFSDNPEVQKLIEERDKLKKENEDLLKAAKEGKYSDEAKIAASKKAILKSIEDLKKKIQNNDTSIKQRGKLTDAELTAYREEQKRLRKELENKRKEAQEGKYSPVEIAKAEAKRKQARIDELNRRINENDFSAEKEKLKKQKTALDDQLEEVKKRYDEAKKQSPEWKEKKSNQFLDRLRKRLDGLSDSQKKEIVARSLKQITDAGGLKYDDFRKIVAETMGYKDLTPEEVKEIETLTQTINSVEDAEDLLVKNPTKENLLALDLARQNAMLAGLKLYNKTHKPTDISRTFSSIITGSLLGGITLAKNIIQNVVMQITMRLPKAAIVQPSEAAISWLGNKFFGSKAFAPSTNLFIAQKGYFKGAKRGIQRGWFNFYKGTQERDYFGKTAYQSTLSPREAIKDLKMFFKGEKPMNKTEVADRIIRSTIGWQPDFILRAMGFGDRPFRWAAEGAAALQIAKLELKLVDENEINAFMYAPKKFAYETLIKQGVPKEEASLRAAEMEDRIIEAGSRAVLEQENALSRASKWLDKGLATKKEDSRFKKITFGTASVIKTATFPFVKIPANVYWQMFKVANPEVAILQSLYHGGKAFYESKNGGDKAKAKREYEYAKDNLATAILGFGVSMAIAGLVSNGYVSPENDEETKAREREGEKPYSKGNQLNWGRLMGGKDYWIDLSWFGPIGTTMAVQAKMQENKKKAALKGEPIDDSWAADFSERFSIAEMESLNQLVFDQASKTVAAIKQGENAWNVWSINMLNTGGNMITGATYVSMSKATLPYVPRLKAETMMEEFKNNQEQRNLLYRMFAGMPPARVSIWGDPIKQDTSFWGVVSNMLGFQESDPKQFGAILYYDSQRTGDMRFFPTPATDKITVDGEEIKITQDQKDELAKYIGQARKTLVSAFVYDSAFPYLVPVKEAPAEKQKYSNLSDEDKVKSLQMIYDYGREMGFAQFQKVHKEFAPAKLSSEEIALKAKKEIYSGVFKMELMKTALKKGKEIPQPTEEEQEQLEKEKAQNQENPE